MPIPVAVLRCLFFSLLVLAPVSVHAAALSLDVSGADGDVSQSVGDVLAPLAADAQFAAGTVLRSGAEGRFELSGDAVTRLAVGPSGELLLHSGDAGILRARLSAGALLLDTRSGRGRGAGDVRINLGEMRLRVANAAIWGEQEDGQSQVCLIGGAVDLVLPGRTARLDDPGQCVRHGGVDSESSWSIVPMDVIAARVQLLALPTRRVEPAATSVIAAPAPPVVLAPTASEPVRQTPANSAASAPLPSPIVPAESGPEAVAAAMDAAPDLRRWSLVLASFPERDAAEQEAARLRAPGIEPEVREYANGDRRGFRVGIGRYDSRDQAEAARAMFNKVHPKRMAWVARY